MKITFDPFDAADRDKVSALLNHLNSTQQSAPVPQAAPAPTAAPPSQAPVTTAQALPGMEPAAAAPQAAPAAAAISLDDLKNELIAAIGRKGGDPAQVFDALKGAVPGFTQLPAATPDMYPAIMACLKAC